MSTAFSLTFFAYHWWCNPGGLGCAFGCYLQAANRHSFQKNEPPVGALAARAWGMEGTTLKTNLFGFLRALLAVLLPMPYPAGPTPRKSSQPPGSCSLRSDVSLSAILLPASATRH